MNEILTRNELQDLTGYQAPRKIIEWLKKNRIPYMLSGSGLPKVNRNALAYIMGAPVDKPKKIIDRDYDKEGFSP